MSAALSTQAKVDGVYCNCRRYYHTVADLEEHFRIANADDDVEPKIHRPVESSRKRRAKVTDARTSADEQDDDNDDEGVGGRRVCVEICNHPRFCVTPRLSFADADVDDKKKKKKKKKTSTATATTTTATTTTTNTTTSFTTVPTKQNAEPARSPVIVRSSADARSSLDAYNKERSEASSARRGADKEERDKTSWYSTVAYDNGNCTVFINIIFLWVCFSQLQNLVLRGHD